MEDLGFFVWVEITANKQRLLDARRFEETLHRCRAAGIDSIILSVKDTSGFCLYNSRIAPHYAGFDADFERRDYLKEYLTRAHAMGLKLYAAVDVFAEGSNVRPNPASPGFRHPEWQTQLLGLDENGIPAIRPISALGGLRTSGSIDDFGEVFVDPNREDVQDYEASLLGELVNGYSIDGIVLDRARFVGLSSDFGDDSHRWFERFSGKKVENWPANVLMFTNAVEGVRPQLGPRFGEWMEFRAAAIRRFIERARGIVDAAPRPMEFMDYTGSWYPLYYMVGANWASERYAPEEYPWVGETYRGTGYAEQLDTLLSGFYYPEVTVEEARANGRPADWYSVEGSAAMACRVTMGRVPVIGSLFLEQYRGDPARFERAVRMCFARSRGCMLFDLSYLDDYDWWEACRSGRGERKRYDVRIAGGFSGAGTGGPLEQEHERSVPDHGGDVRR